MGFDYFYGFVGGDANQWQPNLFRNTIAIYPYADQPGWNLIAAQADDAISYMRRLNALNPAVVHLLRAGGNSRVPAGEIAAKMILTGLVVGVNNAAHTRSRSLIPPAAKSTP